MGKRDAKENATVISIVRFVDFELKTFQIKIFRWNEPIFHAAPPEWIAIKQIFACATSITSAIATANFNKLDLYWPVRLFWLLFLVCEYVISLDVALSLSVTIAIRVDNILSLSNKLVYLCSCLPPTDTKLWERTNWHKAYIDSHFP